MGDVTSITKSLPRPSHLPYGTTIPDSWADSWITQVKGREMDLGFAICGDRRTELEMDDLVERGRVDPEDTQLEEAWVCTNQAGLNTTHPREGRCYRHGGNDQEDNFSLIANSGMSQQIRQYFESEDLLDLRGAVAVIWKAVNDITDSYGDEPLSVNAAKEIGALMTRVGTLTKQHNEIMEKRKITIEVPEFILWAEHLYELAIKYILDGERDVKSFLREAESYYNATVTLKVGPTDTGDGDGSSNPFGGHQAPALLGPGEPES